MSRHPFGPVALADMDMLRRRVWEPALAEWMAAEGRRVADRLRSRARRSARVLRVEFRNVDDASARRHVARRKAEAVLGDVADRRAITSDYRGVAVRLLRPTVDAAVSAVVSALDVPPSSAVYAEILGRSSRWTTPAVDAVWERMLSTLADGIEAGDGIPGLARRLRAAMAPGATVAESTMIARTEVVSAYNGAVAEMARTVGPDVAGGMEWIATGDGRTRPEHVAADGQIAEFGTQFTVGGESLGYPGDPSGSLAMTVNCRCAAAIVVPEDMPGRRVGTHDVLVALFAVAMRRTHPVDVIGALRARSEAPCLS